MGPTTLTRRTRMSTRRSRTLLPPASSATRPTTARRKTPKPRRSRPATVPTRSSQSGARTLTVRSPRPPTALTARLGRHPSRCRKPGDGRVHTGSKRASIRVGQRGRRPGRLSVRNPSAAAPNSRARRRIKIKVTLASSSLLSWGEEDRFVTPASRSGYNDRGACGPLTDAPRVF